MAGDCGVEIVFNGGRYISYMGKKGLIVNGFVSLTTFRDAHVPTSNLRRANEDYGGDDTPSDA